MSSPAAARDEVTAEYLAFVAQYPTTKRWSLANNNQIQTQKSEPDTWATQDRARRSQISNASGLWWRSFVEKGNDLLVDESDKEIVPIELLPGRLIDDFEGRTDTRAGAWTFAINWRKEKLGATHDECLWVLKLYEWLKSPEGERPRMKSKVKAEKAGSTPRQNQSLSAAPPIKEESSTPGTSFSRGASSFQQGSPFQAAPPSQAASSKPVNQSSSTTVVSEQNAWMEGPDVSQLRQEYENYLTRENENTRMFSLAQFALQVFKQAKPASVYIPPGSQAQLGRGNADINTADYFAMVPEDADRELLGNLNTPIIIKQSMASRNRPRINEVDFFTELEDRHNAHIDIQDFGKSSTDGSSARIEVGECIMLLKTSNPITRDTLPINLLNIDDNTPNMLPASLCHNRFNLLRNVCTDFRSGQQDFVGKPSYEWIHADITNCIQFRIYGQRGCISGFHVDQLGGGTWVTQEGEGVKAWVILSQLSDEQRKVFEAQGSDWLPDGDLPVIFILPGDTLIMRPGRDNAHAVITVKSSLMTGGMFWDANQIYSTLKKWHWTNWHPTVTNEDPPKQTEGVLRLLIRRLKNSSNPHMFPDIPTMGVLESQAKLVCLPVGKCKCSNRVPDQGGLCDCRSNGRCGCLQKDIGCGTMCHGGIPCNNPVSFG